MAKKDSVVRLCPGFEREAHKLHEREFYADKARRGGGFSRLCRECHKARAREYFKKTYYPEHRTEIIESAKQRQRINKGRSTPL